MQSAGRRSRRSANYWPGFVDALSTLVMVVIFVLLVFMVAQFFLSSALSGRDAALARLTQQINELTDLLALEQSSNEDLRVSLAQLSADLQSANQQKDDLAGQLAALLDSKAELEAALAAAQQRLVANEKELVEAYGKIEADKETIEATLAELALLKSLKDQYEAELAAATASVTDKDKALAELQARVAALEAKLAETQSALVAAQLALSASQEEAAASAGKVDETLTSLEQAQAEAAKLREALADALARLATAEALLQTAEQKDSQTQQALSQQEALTEAAQRQIELMNAQLAALRQQLARLAALLEASETKSAEQEVEIANLGARLNEALASKVQELARYRSEFFGRLREVLGERQDIRIVGDRFVFQSEVLFESGRAELGAAGVAQIQSLAATLKEIIPQIPAEIDWVLQVNGHTDRRPVVNSPYPSNWELSQARALSVVRALMDAGIPPERLVAAGYAEFQPLDPADSDAAYALNRRIEIKLTER